MDIQSTINLTGTGQIIIKPGALNRLSVVDSANAEVGGISSLGTVAGGDAQLLIATPSAGLRVAAAHAVELAASRGVDIQGALRLAKRVVTATATVFMSDTVVFAAATVADITLNLPVSTDPGVLNAFFIICNTGTKNATIDPSGAEQIEGASTYVLLPGRAVHILWDASQWRIVGRFDGGLADEFPVPVAQYQGAIPLAGTTEFLAHAPRTDKAYFYTRFSVSFYTGGGVNGTTDYWNITLRRLTGAVSVVNIVTAKTLDNGWTHLPDKVPADMANNPTATNDIWHQVHVEKVGAPNAIYPIIGAWARFVL
jgi:hypothetical protein